MADKMVTHVVRGEYKGHPLLVIKPENAHPRDKGISFGLRKAQLILASIAEIEAFVAEKLAERGVGPEKKQGEGDEQPF